MSESLQFKGTPGEWFVAWNDIYTRTEIVACCMVADKTDEQAKANAKLISAAPEMLSLLQWIYENTNSSVERVACDKLIKKALL